jgi:hypothetical protein
MFTVMPMTGLLVVGLVASAFAQPADRSQRGPARGSNFVEQIKSMDRNGDGEITRREASGPAARMFSRLDTNADGVIDEAEITAMAARVGRGRAGMTDGGGAVVGITAPDFTLQSVDGKREVTLSSFANKKPVALIFGSYT